MWGDKEKTKLDIFTQNSVNNPTVSEEVGVISKNTEFKGDINYSGRLNIEGTVEGNIKPKNLETTEIYIGKTGKVTGIIEATTIVIEGEILGTVKGNDVVDLKNSAKISGEVYYKHLIVDSGASIEAKLSKIKD